ncbi:RICIN domain-containing protein [Kitasatospora sp. NPDC088134]|uniref:RICIN domain-containing protein n=1 Tax=Kitasatospora sp. NPDC088134 TaxID=3364071 RepID=UPI0038293A60
MNMKSKLGRATVAGLLSTVLCAGATAVEVVATAGPAAAEYTDPFGCGNTCNTTGAVTAAIGAARDAANTAKADNARFTQQVVSGIAQEVPGYNILVFKYMGTDSYDIPWFYNDFDASGLRGVVFSQEVKLQHYDSIGGPAGYDRFYIWVFYGDSTFVNKGDGGFMNWAFLGQDSDSTVSGGRRIHFPDRSVARYDPNTPITPGVPATPGTPSTPSAPVDLGAPMTSGIASTDSTVKALRPTVMNGRTPLVKSGSVVAAPSGSAATGWTFNPLGGGKYKIVNTATGLALTENTKTYFAGASAWTGAATQKWEVVAKGVGYQIRIDADNCLTYDEDNKTLGVWTCTSDANQQWKLL